MAEVAAVCGWISCLAACHTRVEGNASVGLLSALVRLHYPLTLLTSVALGCSDLPRQQDLALDLQLLLFCKQRNILT